MYGLDGMWEYFYGAMATRTGMTQVFELTWLPDRGIVLRLPAANHPEKAAPYVHRAGHLAVFDQSTRWCALLGVNNAADVAEMMEGHRFRHFIRLNEALHDKAIADIAADIAIQHKKIVLGCRAVFVRQDDVRPAIGTPPERYRASAAGDFAG